jgi:LPXTG-motif cell wall-anchored protein
MKKFIRTAGALAVATVSVLALSACGDEIVIDSLNGAGTCDGNAVSIATSQSESGDNVTINYTGPSVSDVSLFMAQGFYVDEAISPYGEPINAFGIGVDQPLGLKLEVTDPGWSTSGSGNSTTYSFSGSIATLIDNATTVFDDQLPSDADIYNDTVPVVIGVDCNESNVTGDVTSSWQIASDLYPNNMLINALEAVSSEAITNGSRVTFRYPADALTSFGSFTPATPVALSFIADNPEIDNDSVTLMWAQAFADSGSGSASGPVANPDGTFSVDFTGANGTPLADGDYLLIGFVPNENMSAAKVVFASVRYSVADGFKLQSLPFLPELPASPTLPDTGVDASQVALIAGAGALVALTGFALIAVRRSKNS